jgi:hypothetical protein
MHTEDTKNETNRKIEDSRRNDGSLISGSGHVGGYTTGTGCGSDVPQEEQRKAPDQTGKLPEPAGRDAVTARSKKPVAAIREAKRRAVIWGFSVADVISEGGLPYDFVAVKDGITSFVCVRRVNSSWFDIDMIKRRCRKQIDAFRSMNMEQGLIFELWVRGYARAFYRYRVLPDTIGEIGTVLEPETRAGKKALDEAMTYPVRPETADEDVAGDA